MLRQPLVCQTKSIKPQTDASDERLLLLDIVNENHYAYHMETRDRPNNAIRLLVELHRLGGNIGYLGLSFDYSILFISYSGTALFSLSKESVTGRAYSIL